MTEQGYPETLAREFGRGCGWGIGLVVGAAIGLAVLYLIVRALP